MEYVKIFGYTRCGTNYITEITKTNFINTEILVSEFCSKHNRLFVDKGDDNKIRLIKEREILKDLNENDKKINSLIIIKNPYAWYNSMKNWRGSSRENDKNMIRYRMESYINFYDHYLNLDPNIDYWGNKMIIKYEDLLENPDKILKEVSLVFKIKRESEIFIPNKVRHSDKFTDTKKDLYLNSTNNYDLTDFEINEINKLIIPSKYGYKKIRV